MTFDEAKTILASVAVLDNRTVDAVTIQMWQSILDPYTLSEIMWALREFSRTNHTDYLRPAHLVAIVNHKRAEYALINPSRQGRNVEAWLKFEAVLEAAAEQNKELRAKGLRYAVEAMQEMDAVCGVVNPRMGWVCGLEPGHTGEYENGRHLTISDGGERLDWFEDE